MTGRLALFSLVIFVFPIFLSGQPYPVSEVDSLISEGLSYTWNLDFESAEECFIKLDKSFPELPAGKIFLSALFISRQTEFELPLEEEKTEQLLEEAIEKSEKFLSEDENNIWANYFMGLSHAWSAYYYSLNGNFINTVTDGYYAISWFDRCYEIDSTFYEASTIRGTYKYWISKYTDVIQWMPFVPDQMDEGIVILEEVVKKAEYSKLLAFRSLFWIYIDLKEYNKALDLVNNYINENGENPLSKYLHGRILIEFNKTEALKIFDELYKFYEDKGDEFCVIKVRNLLTSAKLYTEEKKYKIALRYCKIVLNNYIECYEEMKRDDGRIKETQSLFEELKEKIGNSGG